MILYPTVKMAPFLSGTSTTGGSGGFGNAAGGDDAYLQPGDTFRFTNGSGTGRDGPSLSTLRTAYDTMNSSVPVVDRWWNNNSNFTTEGAAGIQRWTVPATGNYNIEFVSPRTALSTGVFATRRIGVLGKVRMTLQEGSYLYMVCGHQGEIGSYNGGGCGGTFVWQYYNNAWEIIAVAGGTGGLGPNNNNSTKNTTGSNGSTSTSGNAGRTNSGGLGTSGGTNGNRGQTVAEHNPSMQYRPGPGAGWFTQTATNNSNECGYNVESGIGFKVSGTNINGLAFRGGEGNHSGNTDMDGGFGGGGGGHGACNSMGSGGGGGYSGGGVGDECCDSSGGGGGSIINTSANGYVSTITSLQNYDFAPTGSGASQYCSYVEVERVS